MYPFNATTQSVQIIQDHSTRWGLEKDGGNKRWINGQIDRKEEDTVEKDGGKDTVEQDEKKDKIEKDGEKDKVGKKGKDTVEKNEEKDKIEKDGSRRIRLKRIRLRRMEGRIRLRRLEEKDEENDIDINYRGGIRQNRFIQLEYSILNVYVNQYTRRGI